ncbi:hypothetical protein QBC39DRAFT_22220 [Podospora conica]|nr:hypothetical protein QBC39DRAFT_22220 [Schizothecium conicum]
MCPGNSESLVCGTSLDKVRGSSSRLRFAPRCQRLIWQHIIREKATAGAVGDAVGSGDGWDGPDGLLQRMYLVRPDGTPWSSVWLLVVLPKLVSAVQRRMTDAVEKHGLARWKDGKLKWEDWTEGFLSPNWDGVSFDQETALRLLRQGGEAETAKATASPAAPVQAPAAIQAFPDVALWQSTLDLAERPAPTVLPDDSLSCAGGPSRPVGGSPWPPVFPTRHGARQPATQQPVNQQPTTHQPVNQQPATQQPGTQQPVNRQPAIQQPVNQQPATQQPVNQQPATQQPVNQQPGIQQLATYQPATQKPVNQQPATQQPTTQQPGIQQLATYQPATQKPVNQQPATQQLATQQPATHQPVSEQAFTGRQSAPEPAFTHQGATEEDEDDAAWVANVSIDELISILEQGVDHLAQTRCLVLQSYSKEFIFETPSPELVTIRKAREELLVQLCDIGDLLDQKLALEAAGGDEGVLEIMMDWCLPSVIWERVCMEDSIESPILSARMQARLDRLQAREAYM